MKEGRLRMLAVSDGRRMSEFPGGSTLKECGYDLAVEVGLGFAGPKGIPGPILDNLEVAIKQAMYYPEVVKVMKGLEMPIIYRRRNDFQNYFHDEYWQMEILMKDIGMIKKGM